MPGFRALFGALVVSMLGTVVAGLALTVLVYRRTGSPLLSALTFSLSFLPHLFGGALLSGLVDRVPARRLLVGCDLAAAGLVAAMTVSGLPVAALLALVFTVNLLAPVAAGTRSATLRDVLPPHVLVPARSLMRMVAQGAQFAGYAAGGALLTGLPPRAVLAFDAASFLISALLQRVFLRSRPVRGAAGSLARDSLRGVRAVFAVPPLRRLLLLGWLVPALTLAPEALAAPYVARLGLPSSATGWWLMVGPLATIAGEVAGVWLIPAARRRGLAAPLAAAGFVPLLAFAAFPGLVPGLALLAVAGLCGAYLLGLDQWLLEITPAELLGRAYTVQSAGLMVTQGLGFAAAGALAEVLAPHVVIALSGVAGLATVAALTLRRPRSRPGVEGGRRVHVP